MLIHANELEWRMAHIKCSINSIAVNMTAHILLATLFSIMVYLSKMQKKLREIPMISEFYLQ